MWKTILNVVLIIGVVILIGFTFKQCSDNNDLEAELSTKDSVIQYDSLRYSKLAREYKSKEEAMVDLKTENQELYTIIEEGNEQLRYYSNVVLKLKNRIIHRITDSVRFVLVEDTIRVPLGQDSVGFDEENSLVRVHGFTFLYPNKGYLMNIEGKPFRLDVVVTEKNGLFKGYLDTNNPDLELIDMKVRVLREERDKSFWSNFGGMVGISITTRNSFLDAGISFKKFGIRGILGYDYQNLQIDKNNGFFGGGIYMNF